MSTGETPDIDSVLDDYSRQRQPVDAGLDELNNIMAVAKQMMEAARTARFTEEQAFQISLKYLDTMFQAAARAATEG
jgi:hypothetical protein